MGLATVNQYSKGTFGGRGGGDDGGDDPIPFVLTLVLAPALRDPQPLANGSVERRNNSNASSPSSLPTPILESTTDTGRVAVSVVAPFVAAAVADNLPFASSSCNRASSSAVSWMYDAGGRGKSGGGVRGDVDKSDEATTCLWSRGLGSSLCIGEGSSPGVGGVLGGELYSCCRCGVTGGSGDATDCSSASYFALSNAFSSAALRIRCSPGCAGLGGKGGERARRCGGSPDCVAGGAGCQGGGGPPFAATPSGSEPLTPGGSVPVAV